MSQIYLLFFLCLELGMEIRRVCDFSCSFGFWLFFFGLWVGEGAPGFKI